MLELLLPTLALVAALASSLTWRHAPPWGSLWKVAIAVGEFGHVFLLVPLGVGALAALALEGWLRGATLGLCAYALVCLLRPILAAARLARGLPHGLAQAFGGAEAGPPFSVARLFVRP